MREELVRHAFVKRRVVLQLAASNEPLRIVDRDRVPGVFRGCCEREQPEVRMHVEQGKRTLLRKNQIVDEEELHGSSNWSRSVARSCSSSCMNAALGGRPAPIASLISAAERVPSARDSA